MNTALSVPGKVCQKVLKTKALFEGNSVLFKKYQYYVSCIELLKASFGVFFLLVYEFYSMDSADTILKI